MDRIKRVFRGVHIVVWMLFSALAALQLSQNNSNWPPLTGGFILTCLYVFYGHFALLTRHSGKKKKAAYYVSLAAIILTSPFIYLIFYDSRRDSPNSFFEQYAIHMVSIVLPFIFLSWLARVTENLVINTVKKEQLEKGAVEAELYYLKSQMAPHFLFNTLNNIHTLVYKQSPAAPEAVMQLASLMRYMIYESNAPTAPLSRELEYLQDYMSLQQLRYKVSPVVDLKIEGDTSTCQVAPLLFIHLLENAYKHSPALLAPRALKVRVEVKGDTLTFSVRNPVGKKGTATLNEPGGIGLPNVRKRLLLLYPGQHTLDISNSGETFTVILHMNGLHSQPHERKTHLLYH
ncbi:MAG TPA: histidine kinase [Flavisolibacter sp.]